LQNFTANAGETQDFRVNYAFSLAYYDTTPESKSSVLALTVKQGFKIADLGADRSNGKVFSYTITLKNNKTVVLPPVNNATPAAAGATPIWNGGGLGMTLAVLRVPSCLQVDFTYLENLKRNKKVDFYEVRNFNSEIVLYWRSMAPGATLTTQVNLLHRYGGTCLQKPHNAYPYYNNDQPVWVLPVK
jgi:hypothetical protein